MAATFVTTERKTSLAIVRLDRPEKRNALTRAMMIELAAVFTKLNAEPKLRAIILTGAGEQAFCAGTDIAELASVAAADAREASERGQTLCNQIENCRVPVIAAINGIAAGGGCELALACHLRIAALHARFSLPETRLGLIPGYGGSQRLAREVGSGRALAAMLSARAIDAREALQVGLVNQVVPAAELLSSAESLAREIAALAPLAVRACLEAVTRGSELPLAEGLALESQLFAALFASDDVREGTQAFLEKRAPVFKGC
jgi:enoyl-CoA hydratase